ncbi:MAG: SGNH/GDSL hydrolase family protein [Ruminococcaceae bacterium]|nr:SGNH/GDSL hydrolase family protein [Oscillospiraceae bacterium]
MVRKRILSRICCVLLAAVLLLGCAPVEPTPSVTPTEPTKGAETKPTEPQAWEELETGEYSLDTFTQNMFEGDTVYHDSICFAEDADGNISDGVLLYTPDRIVNVCSTDLKTVYQEGVDFVVEGNRLIRTENSRIPVFAYEDYAQPNADNPGTGWLRIVATDMEIRITDKMMACQVFVTYTHSDSWNGAVATSQLEYLPRTAELLAGKQPVRIVFFGDSITCGYDASGQDEYVIRQEDNQEIHAVMSRAPYMPSWAEMVTAKLRKTYDYNAIVKINRAASGSGTYWGRMNAASLINPHKPDLVVIAFGMNQPHSTKEEFKADIIRIIRSITDYNPQAEFLLVSAMMPNTQTVFFKKHKLAQQEEALYAVREELTDVHIGVVPVHSVFASMMENGKKFVDYASNNVNHPNDFGARVYAQLILAALEGG